MKRVLVLVFVAMMSFVMHKYYVSVLEISLNEKSNQLELSLKVFNDDWQNALDKRLGRPVLIGSHNQYKKLDSLAYSYLEDNLSLKVNDKHVKLNFLGSEIEDEATWIYFYVDITSDIESIEVQDKILTELFDEQRNVVQLNIGKLNKSALLTKSRNTKVFVIKK